MLLLFFDLIEEAYYHNTDYDFILPFLCSYLQEVRYELLY